MAHITEIIMLICFGLSWPLSVVRSYRARTAKGKSPLFLAFIILGYLFGIASKFIAGNAVWYVVFFYILNTLMVSLDLIIWFRNRQLDIKNS